jgi:hypothetical protein
MAAVVTVRARTPGVAADRPLVGRVGSMHKSCIVALIVTAAGRGMENRKMAALRVSVPP